MRPDLEEVEDVAALVHVILDVAAVAVFLSFFFRFVARRFCSLSFFLLSLDV